MNNRAPIDFLLQEYDNMKKDYENLWAEVQRQDKRIRELEEKNNDGISGLSEESKPKDIPGQ